MAKRPSVSGKAAGHLILKKTLKGRFLFRLARLIVTLSEESFRWLIPAEDCVIRRRLLKTLGLKLAKPVFIDVGFTFEYGHDIEIGPYTFLRQNAYLGDWDHIRIGMGTSIGRNLSIYTSEHDRFDSQPKGGPLSIGNFYWIASNVVILPGVTIGNDCIIGGGGVVAHDIPDESIAYDCPATVVSRRGNISETVYTGFGIMNRSTKALV